MSFALNVTPRKTRTFFPRVVSSLNKRQSFRVPDHRCDESLWRRNRNVEVHVVAINYFVTLRKGLKIRSLCMQNRNAAKRP